jgi:two-component system, NarL family, sensor histidine kinase DegS
MSVNFDNDNGAPVNRFSKLGTWYILALGVIATLAITGQILIQQHLNGQLSDSRVVNLAGTQRYKSQAIVKMSLLLYFDSGQTSFQTAAKLETVLEEWKNAHAALQNGSEQLILPGANSDTVKILFRDIEPYFQQICKSADEIIDLSKRDEGRNIMKAAIQTLLANEPIFLSKMDKIVFQYDAEAREKITVLRKLEYILLGISIFVITLEILFVFRPTTLQVNHTINQLMLSEKNAKKLSKEIGELYASLEKTYEELSIVNQPVENPRLFAKGDKGGNVIFIGEALTALTGITTAKGGAFDQLFPDIKNGDDWMDDVVDVVSDGESWQGEIRFEGIQKKDCWVQITITPVYNDRNEVDELVMMGTDITRRKEAEQNMNVKNRAQIEKKINQQKFRSVLILEGQEEERKRLAMDIHDGIGQMLTSLKFQFESIDLKDKEKAAAKIREIEQLIREVIREVRKVTFNLKPTVLGDFGLSAALNVFVQEIGKLTDIKLIFHSSGEEIERLPQKTENNIFRIIQEAINNAIKYSGAQTIYVDMRQSHETLVITVKDEGHGFDLKLVEGRNVNIESGRGFFNMYERTEYVNGTLVIDSTPGKGTVVTLTVPVQTTITNTKQL